MPAPFTLQCPPDRGQTPPLTFSTSVPGIALSNALCICCRVQALKALCEIRLEKDDIVFLIEDAIKPCKATRQAAKQTGFWPSLDDFRREPMGEDSSGLAYYWFDLHLSPEGEPDEPDGLSDAGFTARDECPGVQHARAPVLLCRRGQAVKGSLIRL